MARDEARITDCGHPGCVGCLSAWLVKASTCPICRHSITLSSLFALPADESDYVEPQEVKPIESAKIDELCKYLTSFHLSEKSLVFSQFTGFLNHVEAALEEAGVACCRFDGSMPQRKVSPLLPS
jgi:SWI/SNF-related matrix-associated actin-dependent regulator of chromatin subfamily A3